MLASLRHFWRLHIPVVLTAAVATAVLTGALVVGDAMRGSLRALTLERLGRIDHALLGEGFFPITLAQRLQQKLPGNAEGEPPLVVPLVLLRGSVRAPERESRASDVGIQGVDESFAELYPATGAGAQSEWSFDRDSGQAFASAWVNRALAEELGVAPGEPLILQLARPSDVPRETLVGSTDPSDIVQTLRVVVRGVLPEQGPGRFGLQPRQSLPKNVFVPIADLQRALDQRGRVNALLVAAPGLAAADIESATRSVLELEDLGLEARAEGAVLELSSRQVVLRSGLEQVLLDWAADRGAQVLRVSTYLANRTWKLEPETGQPTDRLLPYSTITAFDTGRADAFGSFADNRGRPIGALAEDQVIVSQWAAEDLDVEAGDRVRVEYWEVGSQEQLLSRSVDLEVAAIVPLEGLAADAGLTPPFPGVHDADNMADWDPTFPVELGLIRDRDEQYWDRYGATPKLFVAEALGRRLWSSRFGESTSLRLLAGPPDADASAEPAEAADSGSEPAVDAPAAAEELLTALRNDIGRRAHLEIAGLGVQPLKAQGLTAAQGATDFGGLFVGFSLFLIVSAALLVGLFFRLGVERRAREVGLRMALGYSVRSILRLLTLEGLVLAGIGAVLGIGLAVLYARLMLWALQTLWVGAIGARFLELHVSPLTLIGGALGSLVLVAIAIQRSVSQLARLPVTVLLKGGTREELVVHESRRARRVWIVAVALAALLLVASMVAPSTMIAPVFLALGAVLLVAGLALFSRWLGQPRDQPWQAEGPQWRSLLRLAVGNATWNPGRSVLAATLVSSAAFLIVAVGAYGHRFGEEVGERGSGAGGFRLMAESDVPLYHDLDSADGLFELGLLQDEIALLEEVEIVPLRVLPGDDVSCLNLYQPDKPRVLGVPQELIERGGFAFQGLAEDVDHPWSLLQQRLPDGAIPAFGDYNSVMWILKSGLGKDVVLEDEAGEEVRLRLVGLLRRSVFQSELLVAEDMLLEHFPSREGYQEFLIDVAPERETEVAALLEERLGRFGFDVVSSEQVLVGFQAVENTYLSTFQTLGGLGLLLGTIGLAVLLLRSVLERAGELATMRAVGYPRRSLASMVLAENTLLLVAGLVIGSVAALIAVSPHLRGGQALVPWGSLIWTLLSVVAVGSLACLAAVRQALRVPLLPALRSE